MQQGMFFFVGLLNLFQGKNVHDSIKRMCFNYLCNAKSEGDLISYEETID